MEYEWDEAKSASNLRRRGFGFEIVLEFNWELSLLLQTQWESGEERDLYVGPIGRTLYTVVTTDRGELVRIISLRMATSHEKKLWRLEMQNG